MSAEDIWLGRPGELVPPNRLSDVNATRIGGPAVYPDGCQVPKPETLQCKKCKSPLALMLLTQAPLDASAIGIPIHDRFLYVYCCIAKECGAQGSWQAFRCQQRPSQQQAPKQQKKKEPPPVEAKPKETLNLNLPSTAGWGCDETSQEEAASSSSAFGDFGDLCSAFDTLNTAAAASKKSAITTTTTSKQQQKQQQKQRVLDVSWNTLAPCLPAFYLHAEQESKFVKNVTSRNRSNDDDDDDEDYRPPHTLANTKLPPEIETDLELCNASSGGDSATGAGETWDGEGYEADAVLVPEGRTGADAAFLKFSRRVAACPDQCARYGFGGSVLWPTEQRNTPLNKATSKVGVNNTDSKVPLPPPCCERCGASRTFELQLMPPVINFLEESADWIEGVGDDLSSSSKGEGQGGVLKIARPPSGWEWVTVVVFTCSKSCCGGGEQLVEGCLDAGYEFIEESVFVVNE